MKRDYVILGSAFNPVHDGHFYIAEQAYKRYSPKTIFFVPTGLSAHKSNKQLIADSHRFEMLKLAVKEHNFLSSYISIETCEIDRDGVSYAVDTLKFLIQKYNITTKPIFIIGDDLIPTLPKWKNINELKTLTDFCVFSRGICDDRDDAGWQFVDDVVQIPIMDISSSELRLKLKEHPSKLDGLSKSVLEYIYTNGLYCEN